MGWRRILLSGLVLVLLLVAYGGIARADRPEVDIIAQDTARPGESVPIVLGLHHEDSGPGHYVDSVRLYDGDRLLKEWSYGRDSYEKAEEWSVTYTGSFDRTARLRAVVRCNLHGDGSGSRDIVLL